MQYRRAFVPGGSYFFTVVTNRRLKIFINDSSINILREAFRRVKNKRPFKIDAIVILPDHLHCIWTIPDDDRDYPTRWRLIKTWFTKHWKIELQINPGPVLPQISKRNVWQKRYWEHLLQDEKDYRRHIEYIHYNPVKHGYTKHPMDWRYSSFRKYVKQGIYPEAWGDTNQVFPESIGNE